MQYGPREITDGTPCLPRYNNGSDTYEVSEELRNTAVSGRLMLILTSKEMLLSGVP
jgi:hypothetical protein